MNDARANWPDWYAEYTAAEQGRASDVIESGLIISGSPVAFTLGPEVGMLLLTKSIERDALSSSVLLLKNHPTTADFTIKAAGFTRFGGWPTTKIPRRS